MSKRKNIERMELLLPGETAWERWSAVSDGAAVKESSHEFGGAAHTRTLALPAAALWVLPAWLQTRPEHLQSSAALYLERAGVRIEGGAAALDVAVLAQEENACLTRIMVLRDVSSLPADFNHLPDACVPSASCYQLPANSITIWRELGRWVMAMTIGDRAACFSVLSAASLDEEAVREVMSVCFQLGFQNVLRDVHGIVLWTSEGSEELIGRITGLPVRRMAKPAPRIRSKNRTALMPESLRAAKNRREKSSRKRTLALAAGAVVALGIAVVVSLAAWANHQRNELREQVALLTPRAAKVGEMQKMWNEAAPAVDPEQWAMETLLRVMETSAPDKVSLMQFECTPERVLLRGRTPDAGAALQFAQAIKSQPSLAVFNWEAAPPTISSDNSASFELKGVKP